MFQSKKNEVRGHIVMGSFVYRSLGATGNKVGWSKERMLTEF